MSGLGLESPGLQARRREYEAKPYYSACNEFYKKLTGGDSIPLGILNHLELLIGEDLIGPLKLRKAENFLRAYVWLSTHQEGIHDFQKFILESRYLMEAFFNQDFSAFETDFFQRLGAFKNYQALSRGGYLYEELREVQLLSGEKICLNSLCPWHPRFAEYCNTALNKLTVKSPEGMKVIKTSLPKGVELCVTLDQSIEDGSLLSPFEGRGSPVSIEAPSVSPETRDSSSSSASTRGESVAAFSGVFASAGGGASAGAADKKSEPSRRP